MGPTEKNQNPLQSIRNRAANRGAIIIKVNTKKTPKVVTAKNPTALRNLEEFTITVINCF